MLRAWRFIVVVEFLNIEDETVFVLLAIDNTFLDFRFQKQSSLGFICLASKANTEQDLDSFGIMHVTYHVNRRC